MKTQMLSRNSPLCAAVQEMNPLRRRDSPVETSMIVPAETKLLFAVPCRAIKPLPCFSPSKALFANKYIQKQHQSRREILNLKRGGSTANTLAKPSASVCNTQSQTPASDEAAQGYMTTASLHQCSETHLGVRDGHFQSQIRKIHRFFQS